MNTTYNQDYRYFSFESTKYYSELSEMSFILANMINKVDGHDKTWKNTNNGENYTATGVAQYMWYIGLEDQWDYSNNDVPFAFGQHDAIYKLGKVNNLRRNIITCVIGENDNYKGKLTANYDGVLGADGQYQDYHHVGYDIEANKIFDKLVEYETPKSWKKVYWIVGYGTGGSIANLVGKKMTDKYGADNVFCYTFGAPAVVNTQEINPASRVSNVKYQNIFNVENDDDFILKETDRKLGYYKYGWKVSASVEKDKAEFSKTLKSLYCNSLKKQYNGKNDKAKEYLDLMLQDYKKYCQDKEVYIRNEPYIASAHSDTAYSILAQYAEPERSYVYFFKADEMTDSDGDGLTDTQERYGIDFDKDGVIDVKLNEMGADPNQKDLFIELDYMRGCEPNQSALQEVVDVFEEHDITMHIDAGPYSINFPDELSKTDVIPKKQLKIKNGNSTDYTEWQELVNSYFDINRREAFRHCLYIDGTDYSGLLGIANRIPGMCFISVKGLIGKTNLKLESVNFMHELGHTLGLTHGGENNDHTIFKPNHLSIMNYAYSNTGLYPNNDVNYSEFELPMINKKKVNEEDGIDPNSNTDGFNLGIIWYIGNENTRYYQNDVCGQSIDFNQNNSIENNISINFYLKSNVYNDTIQKTINEWDNLVYKPTSIGGFNQMITNNMKEWPIEFKQYDERWSDLISEYEGTIDFTNIGVVKNTIDNKYYAVLEIKNSSHNKVTAKIDLASKIFMDRIISTKVNIPENVDTIQSSIKVYIPIVDNLSDGEYEVEVMCNIDGQNDNRKYTDYVNFNKDCEVINEENIIDGLIIEYGIRDFSYKKIGTNEYGLEKFNGFDCIVRKDENGIYTSDAYDDIHKYTKSFEDNGKKAIINGLIRNNKVLLFISIIIILAIVISIAMIKRKRKDYDFE